MNIYAKLAAAAAIVLVVGFVGYRLLPSTSGAGTATAAPTAAPTPSLLARGTFKVKGADVVLEATGLGSDVTGRMSASHDGVQFTVDLECTRTQANALLWFAGNVTESTDTYWAPEGTRAAIVFKRGSPVQAVFIFQLADPPSTSCQDFIDDNLALGDPTPDLEAIEGTVQLAP